MTRRFLPGISALAIMAAMPALAETYNGSTEKSGHAETQAHSNGDITKDAKKVWEKTKDTVSHAAENVSETTRETYQDIKAELVNETDTSSMDSDVSRVMIDQRMTAAGMIGQPVYNQSGERVAKIEDIIIGRNGDAMMVVLVDGDWTGLGKMAAFDYNMITDRNAEGDVIVPLTEDMLSRAASFSYDRGDYSDTVKVIPSNGYSVAQLLDTQLVNPKGEEIAEVDNISFRNGEADRLIVGFGGVLGIGENQAALDYSALHLAPNPKSDDRQLDFKLTAAQVQQFENFKNAAVN